MKVGNQFEVDVAIECKAPKKTITSIDQTINYVEVYRILQEEFNQRRLLLETLAMDIANRVEEQFPDLEKFSISIRKLNPPITNFAGSVSVGYTKVFK